MDAKGQKGCQVVSRFAFNGSKIDLLFPYGLSTTLPRTECSVEGCVDEACGFKRASAITTIKDRPKLYRKRTPMSRLWCLLQLLSKDAFFEFCARCFILGSSFHVFCLRLLSGALNSLPQTLHPSCLYRAATMRSPRMLGSIHFLGCQFSGQQVSTGVMEYILLSGNLRAHLAIAEIDRGSWIPFSWALFYSLDLFYYSWSTALPDIYFPRGLG